MEFAKKLPFLFFVGAFLLPSFSLAATVFLLSPQTSLHTEPGSVFSATTTALVSVPNGSVVFYQFCSHYTGTNTPPGFLYGDDTGHGGDSVFGNTQSFGSFRATPNQTCSFATTTVSSVVNQGQAYSIGFVVNALQGGASVNLSASGDFLFVSDTPIQNVDWNALSLPFLTPVGTSSVNGISATSSLWSSYSTSTMAGIIGVQCASGNIFQDALCNAFAFLFEPNPNILNSFIALPQTESSHWPFSWIVEVQQSFSSQTTSSSNFTAYSMNLGSVDPSTSTALHGILPTFTFLASSTVIQYIGVANWDILQALMTAALFLVFVYDVFFTLRNRFHRV